MTHVVMFFKIKCFIYLFRIWGCKKSCSLNSFYYVKLVLNVVSVNRFDRQAMLLLRLSIRVFFNNQVNSNLENLQVWNPTPPSDKNSKYDGLGFEEFYNKLHLIVK